MLVPVTLVDVLFALPVVILRLLFSTGIGPGTVLFYLTPAPDGLKFVPERVQRIPRGWPWHTGDVRIGIDLVAVADVAAAIDAQQDRYVTRIYTAAEVAASTTAHGLQARRLAAHYAAKEAAVKLLAPGDEPMPLAGIELHREPRGADVLRLSGAAAALAAAAGYGELRVSVSAGRRYAAAVVTGEIAPDRRNKVA
jgi:holo-[acyl-carrier protein] synthase